MLLDLWKIEIIEIHPFWLWGVVGVLKAIVFEELEFSKEWGGEGDGGNQLMEAVLQSDRVKMPNVQALLFIPWGGTQFPLVRLLMTPSLLSLFSTQSNSKIFLFARCVDKSEIKKPKVQQRKLKFV